MPVENGRLSAIKSLKDARNVNGRNANVPAIESLAT